MKVSRRTFVKSGIVASSGLLTNTTIPSNIFSKLYSPASNYPMVISTWDFGIKSNSKAIEYLREGRSSLEAVEAGIILVENDPEINSVGYGGRPDEDGIVSLDAAIMDWRGEAGAVAAIEGIKNPISVARLVMEKTNHVMLAGKGAQKFALKNGFKKENLLTKNSKDEWLEWKKNYSVKNGNASSKSNHDTIGMLAIDLNGNMSGGISTSGMAFKLRGRVGDSSIIGAALFVDNEIGGAAATGNGEFMMKSLASFLVVEKMREGMLPEEACEFTIKRIYAKYKKQLSPPIQIGLIAMSKNGNYGAFSLFENFEYAFSDQKNNFVIKGKYLL